MCCEDLELRSEVRKLRRNVKVLRGAVHLLLGAVRCITKNWELGYYSETMKLQEKISILESEDG